MVTYIASKYIPVITGLSSLVVLDLLNGFEHKNLHVLYTLIGCTVVLVYFSLLLVKELVHVVQSNPKEKNSARIWL